MEWLDLEELEEKDKIEMFEAEKRWLEVRSKGWKKELNKVVKKELEMYQKMMSKKFEIKAIAFIFSVSEESIKKLLMKA